MEWVVTTASTIEGARELALDELGVDASEAEFQVLQEPSKGFVGIGAKQARVQARIVPNLPRAKQERRPRRKRTKQSERPSTSDRGRQAKPVQQDSPTGGSADKNQGQKNRGDSKQSRNSRSGRNSQKDKARSAAEQTESTETVATQTGKSGQRRSKDTEKPRDQQRPQATKEDRVEDPMTLEEQGKVATAFLTGMCEQMGLTGDVVQREIDEDNLEVAIDGSDLGLLVGPKGGTLQALQEVTKTVLQRKAVNGAKGRIRVDVGGYREHRREALAAFTTKVADEVRESGTECALEPMVASERKIVHDTINDLDGVGTISEGTDPRRRVVIVPS